jgi:uncharacterized protein YkwD
LKFLNCTLLLLLAATLSFAASGFSVPTASASKLPVTGADEALFDYINQARENPLEMAEAVGLEKEDLLKALPGMREILRKGLPPLSFDQRLYRAADEHTGDMLSNNYYDYISPEGETVADRIAAQGYAATETGEALGVLVFNNFIPEEIGVFQLFANMYRDELRADREGPATILNPAFTDAGVSVYAGIFQFNGFSGNVYMATCDFGAPVATHDLELLQMINQARHSAEKVAETYGYSEDLNVFLSVYPDYESVIGEGLPPLLFDPALYTAATSHAADMLERDYFGAVTPEGRTPEERVADAGYEGEFLSESRFRLPTNDDPLEPGDAVGRLFRLLFSRTLWGRSDTVPETLFSEKACEAATGILAGESETLTGEYGNFLNIGVVEYGSIEKEGVKPSIIGVAYVDANENGLYDAGEGFSNAELIIKKISRDNEYVKQVAALRPNPAGGFRYSAEPGLYKLILKSGRMEKFISRKIEMEGSSLWQSIPVAPENWKEAGS